MSANEDHLRVLLLAKPGSAAGGLMGRFPAAVEMRHVHTFDEALAALREGSYDLVISEQSDFIPLERAAMSHQATLILETLGQGVCIVSMDGRLVWANQQTKASPPDVVAQVCAACVRAYRDEPVRPGTEPAGHRARRFTLSGGNDQHFEVTVTPVVNSRGEVVQAAAVVWDVTNSFRLQKKIDAIDRAGRELVRINSDTVGMNLSERVALLEQRMLGYMRDLLNFDNFAVLLIDKKTNRLEFALEHGMTARRRDMDIYALPENNGISGYVAATGRSYICPNTARDPRYLQGLETARSSLTVPLRLNDEVIGVFNIESDKEAAFNEDDRQFAEILARYLAIALRTLDLIVHERYETSGRMADDVLFEISEPLKDIVTDAQTLMEDYIGNDDLRKRLNAICDNATEIKRRVRDVVKPRRGISGRYHETAVKDPLLAEKRVLVADDERPIRENLAEILGQMGCIVETATDGRDAIAKIEQGDYDLIIADIRMPHKTGFEVFTAARNKRSDVRVILMTGFGYDPHHSIVRAREEGLSAVLFKPFKVEQLVRELHEALQAHKV